MNKKEFLEKLMKETSNERLVGQYDEFIDDRVADGEVEESVVASYDLKRIVRMHELEQREKQIQVSPQADRYNVSTGKTGNINPIVYLVISLVAFALSVVCLILIGYYIGELVEVIGGYYDHMGSAYVRSERIGYTISLVISCIGLVASVIVGIVLLLKYRKTVRR